jgi:hypothetical protein
MNSRTLLHLPYQAARTPLTLLDATLFQRLPDDSPPRLAFDRLVGSIDEVAGRLLDDETIERRGTELRDRADKLSRALQLAEAAAEHRRAAADTIHDAEHEADTLRADAERHQVDGVEEAVATEREEERAVTRRARAQAEATKQQADARAERQVASVEQERKRTEARVSARQRQATGKVGAELHEAAERKSAARSRRSDADRLGELAEQKQRARKAH